MAEVTPTTSTATSTTKTINEMQIAKDIGKAFDKAESELLAAYRDPNTKQETLRQKEMAYQKAMTAMQSFMQLMRTAFETTMRAIQNFRLS